MDRYAIDYRIEIDDDRKSDPTFLFYDEKGEVIEELKFGGMSLEEIHLV